jgi:hypothetical protein
MHRKWIIYFRKPFYVYTVQYDARINISETNQSSQSRGYEKTRRRLEKRLHIHDNIAACCSDVLSEYLP